MIIYDHPSNNYFTLLCFYLKSLQGFFCRSYHHIASIIKDRFEYITGANGFRASNGIETSPHKCASVPECMVLAVHSVNY